MESILRPFHENQHWKQCLTWCGLLLFILALAYGNAFHAPWFYDDYPNIVENENVHLKDLTPSALIKACYGRTIGTIDRPLAFLSFALTYYFWELNVFPYHLFNWAIHAAAALLLLVFLKVTLKYSDLSLETGYHPGTIAGLGALLWSISPLHVTAVTLIVQRMAVMATFFFLAGALCYACMRFVARGRLWKTGFALLGLLFWVSGIACKETALTLPLFLLLWDYAFFPRTWSNRKMGVMTKIFLILFIGSCAAALIYLLQHHQYPLFSNYHTRPFTMWERVLTQSRVFWYYLSLLLFPLPDRLTFIHDFQLSHGLWQPPQTLISVAGLMTGLFICLAKLRQYPIPAFAFLTFFLNHLMEGSIISLDIIHEYRNHLPSLFIFPALLYASGKLEQHFRRHALVKTCLRTLLAGFLLLSATATWHRNNLHADPERIWLDNVAKAPRLWMPKQNLAWVYYERNDFDHAFVLSHQALQGYSHSERRYESYSRFCIAMCYVRTGHPHLALLEFEKATENLNHFPDIFHEYSRTLAFLGRYEEAEKQARIALSAIPHSLSYNETLVFILMVQKKWEDTLRILRQVRGWHPGKPQILELELITLLALENREGLAAFLQNNAPLLKAQPEIWVLAQEAMDLLGTPIVPSDLADRFQQIFPGEIFENYATIHAQKHQFLDRCRIPDIQSETL